MLMLPFGRACAASLDAPWPGMNESEKSCAPSLLWVHVFVGARFQLVGASFQLAHAFDKMKSCRHREEEGRGSLNCGSKFSHVGASFQLAHAFDTMKSCRHGEGERGLGAPVRASMPCNEG